MYSASVVAASASGTTILSIRRSDAEEALGPLHKLIQVTENVRTLRGVSIFSSLDLPQLDDLAGKMDHRVYSNHDIIFHENSNSGEFFIIQSGEVEFQKNKNTVGRLFGSEYFGEGSAIMNKPRRATAVAASQNVVCSVISGNDLREIIGGETILSLVKDTFERRKKTDLPQGSVCIRASNLRGLRLLGMGNYGKVSLVRDVVSGKTFAMKQLRKKTVTKAQHQEQAKQERRILTLLRHPFICTLVRTYKNRHSVYMLMEPVLGGGVA